MINVVLFLLHLVTPGTPAPCDRVADPELSAPLVTVGETTHTCRDADLFLHRAERRLGRGDGLVRAARAALGLTPLPRTARTAPLGAPDTTAPDASDDGRPASQSTPRQSAASEATSPEDAPEEDGISNGF